MTINLLPMATQDLLWQVTKNPEAKSDAERAAGDIEFVHAVIADVTRSVVPMPIDCSVVAVAIERHLLERTASV